jgi:hypothetical protein
MLPRPATAFGLAAKGTRLAMTDLAAWIAAAFGLSMNTPSLRTK